MTPNSDNVPLVLNDKSLSAWDAAAAMGIDMSLIEYSLGLTLDERVFQHDCALRTLQMMEEAGKQLHG